MDDRSFYGLGAAVLFEDWGASDEAPLRTFKIMRQKIRELDKHEIPYNKNVPDIEIHSKILAC